MQHGWFLAADFQLVIFTTFILVIIHHFPRYTSYIFGILLSIAIGIYCFIFYMKNLDIGVSLWPELYKHLIVNDKMYVNMHIRTEMLIESTILGLASGYIYDKFKRTHFNPNDYRIFPLLYVSFIPVIILLLISSSYYDFNPIEKPSIVQTIHSIILKLIWGIYISVTFIGFGFKIESKSIEGSQITILLYTFLRSIQRILNLSVFVFLGKLTFCSYLIHPLLMRVIMGQIRTPAYMSILNINVLYMATIIMVYLLSIVLVLFIEMPFSSLINYFVFKKSVNDNVKHNKH